MTWVTERDNFFEDSVASRNRERRRSLAGTYYFYWCDAGTGEHHVDPDGSDALTDHPEREEGVSYRSPEWHRRELLEMLEAGLDDSFFWEKGALT